MKVLIIDDDAGPRKSLLLILTDAGYDVVQAEDGEAGLAVAKDQLKVNPPVAGLVLPLGTTMNMAGTALYEGCVVLFVAQVFGIELGLAQQLTLLFLAVLSAVAVAAIPGGSLPLIAGLLASFGIPPEGIGIILGVDRILDMTRTMVNVGADVVTTTVVDRYTKRAEPR